MKGHERTKVVVVGAGVGGLAAARQLVAGGLDVVVLEARDRVGGRLHSIPAGEAALDLGATWFWADEPRIRSLVSELGLAVHDQHIRGDALYQDPRGVQRLSGNPIEGPAGRLTGGMQGLAEAMVRTLPTGTVRLEWPVTGIRMSSHGVDVEGPAGVVRASAAILAVPPALAAARIRFEPALPSALLHLASTTPVWMGDMTKVVVCYESPFWRDRGLAGAMVSHVGPLREIHDMSGPDGDPAALFGFAPPHAPGSPTVEPGDVLDQLDALLGTGAPRPMEVLIHDWRTEVHTSPPGAERLRDFSTYGHPLYRQPALGGRLHWASTEASTAFPGHIEGALAAAARAVAAIIGGGGPLLSAPRPSR